MFFSLKTSQNCQHYLKKMKNLYFSDVTYVTLLSRLSLSHIRRKVLSYYQTLRTTPRGSRLIEVTTRCPIRMEVVGTQTRNCASEL